MGGKACILNMLLNEQTTWLALGVNGIAWRKMREMKEEEE